MDYPADWEIKKLGEIASYRKDNALVSKKNYISTENIKQNFEGIEQYQSKELVTGTAFEKNNILIANIRPYLRKIYFAEFCGSCSHDVLVLEAKEKIYAKFLYYCLANDNFIVYVMSAVKGTKMPRGDKKHIMQYSINLPPLAEQKAIADTLGTFDTHIKNLSELIEKKKAIRDGALEDLMSGRARLKGFSGDWEVKRLGEIGYTYSGLTGKTKSDFETGNGKFITFLNVLNNITININILSKVNIKENERQNNVKVGDLFFNASSETSEEVGMCAVLLNNPGICYLNSFCFGYRLKHDDINPLFLSYYFNSCVGREFMRKHAQGSTRYNLSKKNFLEHSIFLPPLAEQKAIAETLTAFDNEITALEAERDKIIQIRDGAMEDLLTGKVRLKF